MKRTCTYLICLTLTACSTIHTNVGPKPDVKPVMASNQAAQKSIAQTRTEIKSAAVDLKTGLVGLEAVRHYLEMLTGLPPKQQGIVLLAQHELGNATTEFMDGARRIAIADARADEAERHALDTEYYAKTLSDQIDAAHKREAALAKDNLKMKPVYEQCRKWWGIGAIVYGFGQLIKHLLILAAFVLAVCLALWIATLLGVPGLGFVTRGASWLGGWSTRVLSRNRRHLGQ